MVLSWLFSSILRRETLRRGLSGSGPDKDPPPPLYSTETALFESRRQLRWLKLTRETRGSQEQQGDAQPAECISADPCSGVGVWLASAGTACGVSAGREGLQTLQGLAGLLAEERLSSRQLS